MKFSKVASFAFLALSSYAAIIHYSPDINSAKRDAVLINSMDNRIDYATVSKRDVGGNSDDEHELSKRLSITGVITAIIAQLPTLIKIIGAILKGAGIIKRDVFDNTLDTILTEIPEIVDAFEHAIYSASNNKRDDASDIVAEVISQLPEIISQVVTGVEQTINSTGIPIDDFVFTAVSDVSSIFNSIFDVVTHTIQDSKRDGIEDIVSKVVSQIPDIIVKGSTPILTNTEKVKRWEGSSLLDKLVKKTISISIKTFGSDNIANMVCKRGVSTLLVNMLARA